MTTEYNKSYRNIRVAIAILALGTVLLPFQNCGGAGAGEAGSASSQGGVTLPPNAGGPCPYNSNPPPSGSFSVASVNLNVGMGMLEGNDTAKTIGLSFNSGDSISRVTAISCQVPNNSGITVNCNLNNAATSGSLNGTVNIANGSECLSGPVTITLRINADQIFSGNAPDPRCNSLGRTNVNVATFTVNRINTCLNTQRINPNTPYNNSQFGTAVAIEGMRAVSSAPGDEQIGVDAGAAFVMERALNGVNPWTTTAKLLPSGLGASTILTSVALSGNTIALGSIAAYGGRGGAWVFQYNGTAWTETRAFQGPAIGSNFGRAVAVSGDVVAVGAPGQNFNGNGSASGAVYTYSIATGAAGTTLQPVIQAGDVILRGEFGTSLAYSGTRLAVGAPFPNSSTVRSEAVYVYDNLVLSKKIKNTANAVDRFGYAVSLDGNNLAIGAPYSMNRTGRAYLFVNAGAFPDTATRTYDIPDRNDDDIDSFGFSVAVKGTRVVVGAPAKAETALNYGAAYLYGTNAVTVVRKVRSQAADRSADQFAYSVGLSADGYLISGALNDDQNGFDNTGAAYFVALP